MRGSDVSRPVPGERIGDVERSLARDGHRWVIGVDEAGRGPLAGPVTVAAVALDLRALDWCAPLDDSKRLTPAARENAAIAVRERATAWAVEHMAVAEIDELNILWASIEGMRRAVERVRTEFPACRAAIVLVDGNRTIRGYDGEQRAMVRGDGRSWAIAGASCVAKVARDAVMTELDGAFPAYGFARHKGYPTAAHLEALRQFGPTAHHRRSFGPVAAATQHAEPGSD